MSGRFDGNQSTIGHTPKYTPAHDCREESLENAQRFGKSRAVSCRLGWHPATLVIFMRSSPALNPMSRRHCFFCRLGSHAATRLDGEHRRVRGRIALPIARAGQATFRVCA
jgi:hypothetical protein